MAEPNNIVKEAIDVSIGERGEIGVQVAAYKDGELVSSHAAALSWAWVLVGCGRSSRQWVCLPLTTEAR